MFNLRRVPTKQRVGFWHLAPVDITQPASSPLIHIFTPGHTEVILLPTQTMHDFAVQITQKYHLHSLITQRWVIESGKMMIVHQNLDFPEIKVISLPWLPFGVRSCDIAIIWPDWMIPVMFDFSTFAPERSIRGVVLLCLFWLLFSTSLKQICTVVKLGVSQSLGSYFFQKHVLEYHLLGGSYQL